MKVLVACENSGVVRKAFENLGHDAISCDLLESTTLGKHYKGNVFDLDLSSFDLLIAHPPCTYLTVSAEWAYKERNEINKNLSPDKLYGTERKVARKEAIKFFLKLANSKVKKIAIENPVGVMSTAWRKPDQYIQPYQFGHNASKKTGLWLKNLPLLEPTKFIEPRVIDGKARWDNQTDSGQNKLAPSENRWQIRAKTYSGIAEAMANQWGES
tara:strand:+ start:152 stop:790 length:639 start_codon:yes stop_codon:yes gene_type:complete